MSKRICSFVDCTNEARSQTDGAICSTHYIAKRRALKAGLAWPVQHGEYSPALCPLHCHRSDISGVAEAKAEAPKPEAEAEAGSVTITRAKAEAIAEIFGGGKDERVDEILQRLSRLESSISAHYKIDVTKAGETVEIKGLNHRIFPWVLELVCRGLNVYLCGPSGSGKTTLAKRTAEALKLAFYYTGAILQKYELLGYMDANGNYISTSFYECYKNGGLYLWDEIDASNPGALVAFNAALENGVLAAPNGEMVEIHPDFHCIAAANTIGKGSTQKHAGRQPIDGAVTERYAFVQMNYDWTLSAAISQCEYEDDEKPIDYKVKRSYAQADLDKYFADVRAWSIAVEQLGLNHIISPRAALKGIDLLRADIKRSWVEEAFIWKGLDPDQVRKVKAKASDNSEGSV
jgi:cobaltochelatase CobS